MIEIEKAIPLPKVPNGRAPKYPWRLMEVGDSFSLPIDRRIAIQAMASKAGPIYGKKFATRAIKSEGIVRVWRIA